MGVLGDYVSIDSRSISEKCLLRGDAVDRVERRKTIVELSFKKGFQI